MDNLSREVTYLVDLVKELEKRVSDLEHKLEESDATSDAKIPGTFIFCPKCHMYVRLYRTKVLDTRSTCDYVDAVYCQVCGKRLDLN